jgi:O-antigen ligase
MALLKPEIQNKAYYYLFLALSFCIPVHDKLVPPVIALISFNWLLEFNFKEKLNRFKSLKEKKYILFPALFYLLYVIGTFYSTQIKGSSGALFDLEVKLSLLLFPVFFTTIDLSKLGNDFYKRVLKAFIYGCLISSILLINKAMMDYFRDQDASVFYYKSLSWIHHPSYVALYFTFAIAILMVWLIRNENKNATKRAVGILLIIHFELFIVLLSSKAGILGLVLICFIVLIYFIFREKQKSKIVFVHTITVLVAFGIILLLLPAGINRFYAAKKSIEDINIPDNQKTEGSVARLMVWKCSIEIIKENFFFGVGTGDVKPELNQKYQEKNIQQAIKENLNAHNQYLQTFIAIGFGGFVLLVASLYLPLLQGIKHGKVLLIVFICLFAFHLLVESMLERQAGVVFFAFFSGFLVLGNYSFRQKSTPELPKV